MYCAILFILNKKDGVFVKLAGLTVKVPLDFSPRCDSWNGGASVPTSGGHQSEKMSKCFAQRLLVNS